MPPPGSSPLPPGEAILAQLLASPNLCSRHYAFSQYDSTVQANTVLGPGGGAAVVRVEGTNKAIALTTDCTPRYNRLDPRLGAAQAVAEAARNLACVGAEPIAVTDCLNFGNPEKGLVAWQLTEAVGGMAEACQALGVPVVSGNVSLYNETAGRAIAPTPAVGMVGLLEKADEAIGIAFHEDDAIVLVGEPAAALGASEYREVILGDPDGPFPRFDLKAEVRLVRLLRGLAERKLLRSAQDVSDGGLAVALTECCFAGSLGCRVGAEVLTDLARTAGSVEAALFSEDQGRAVISCSPPDVDTVLAEARAAGVPALRIGSTGGGRIVVGDALDADLANLRGAWESGFAALVKGRSGR